jgi:four helix bundle protein
MQDFKNLKVWHEAHRLALDVHRVCDATRFAKYPGLRSQMLRCAQSIASNIAEGSGKKRGDFARFLDISVGSAKELESDLLFARDLGLISISEFDELNERVDHVRRMLIALIRAVRDRLNTVGRKA